MKLGAADYLLKPFAPEKLDLVLRLALAGRAAAPAGEAVAAEPGAGTGRVTVSAAMARVWRSCSASPTRTSRCCSPARAASARTWSPAASTPRAAAPRGVLKDPSTVLAELAPLAGRAKAGTGLGAPATLASLAAAPLLDEVPLEEVGRRAAQIAERAAILDALTRTGRNKRRAATRLQISYKAVLYEIKDCEIVDPRDSGRTDP